MCARRARRARVTYALSSDRAARARRTYYVSRPAAAAADGPNRFSGERAAQNMWFDVFVLYIRIYYYNIINTATRAPRSFSDLSTPCACVCVCGMPSRIIPAPRARPGTRVLRRYYFIFTLLAGPFFFFSLYSLPWFLSGLGYRRRYQQQQQQHQQKRTTTIASTRHVRVPPVTKPRASRGGRASGALAMRNGKNFRPPTLSAQRRAADYWNAVAVLQDK